MKFQFTAEDLRAAQQAQRAREQARAPPPAEDPPSCCSRLLERVVRDAVFAAVKRARRGSSAESEYAPLNTAASDDEEAPAAPSSRHGFRQASALEVEVVRAAVDPARRAAMRLAANG